ncbi:hypothetical protein NC652_038393 [Populus alba x Populus x berolinensis]|nr:hypothetical protein NC652_038393 [Populus alba x Populus x berolinensis]
MIIRKNPLEIVRTLQGTANSFCF